MFDPILNKILILQFFFRCIFPAIKKENFTTKNVRKISSERNFISTMIVC